MNEKLDMDAALRIVLPIARERSREPGDAWDRAAAALTALQADLAAAVARVEKAKGER